MTDFIKKELAVTPKYCQKVLSKVDKIVRENFFDKKVATEVWPRALEEQRDGILASKDLIEFGRRVNALLGVLNTSHCGLYTHNDDAFYFLRSLFGTLGAKHKQPAYDFTGMGVGGVKCQPNQIRYILDGSPADEAQLMAGDIIQKVNGRPYFGHVNFLGTAGTAVTLVVKRGSQTLVRYLTPVFTTPRAGFVDAIDASAEVLEYSDCKIGYIHLWSGIGESEVVFRDVVHQKLSEVDGFILDLRDGYGALSVDAVDWLYRPNSGMQSLSNRTQDGSKYLWHVGFHQPVMALINGGSRSGKELVALQLKKSGRALLFGEKTAGAMVGGTYFAIDKKTCLYVATVDVEVDGQRLEGVGVSPNINVVNDYNKPGIDAQFDAAVEMLRRKIQRSRYK
jgi:carboxyl-terminal processing protease